MVKAKKETTQPSGMPVVSKRRASWVNRLRKTLKNNMTIK